MSITIFGGSFNPTTNSHIEIVKKLIFNYPNPKIILSTDNPFKNNLLSYEHRLNMLELSLLDLSENNIDILLIQNSLELELGRKLKKRYAGSLRSWHILEHMKTSYPNHNIKFIFGKDMENEVLKFEKIDYIKNNSIIEFIETENHIHSTDIRNMIKEENNKWETHVSYRVSEYIKLHNLYKE